MKLTDKRFWKFEAIVLVCTSICIFILWINHLLWFNFIAFVFCCLFLVGGAMTGKSSVSCPLKPSDSAPLKHSTMPP